MSLRIGAQWNRAVKWQAKTRQETRHRQKTDGNIILRSSIPCLLLQNLFRRLCAFLPLLLLALAKDGGKNNRPIRQNTGVTIPPELGLDTCPWRQVRQAYPLGFPPALALTNCFYKEPLFWKTSFGSRSDALAT